MCATGTFWITCFSTSTVLIIGMCLMTWYGLGTSTVLITGISLITSTSLMISTGTSTVLIISTSLMTSWMTGTCLITSISLMTSTDESESWWFWNYETIFNLTWNGDGSNDFHRFNDLDLLNYWHMFHDLDNLYVFLEGVTCWLVKRKSEWPC